MGTPSQKSIDASKRLWEEKYCTKQIDCPEHPGDHKATLFTQGHRYEGTWECPVTGDSDAHEHDPENYEIETGETWPTGPLDTPHEFRFYVCGGEDGCGVAIDSDIADPDVDAADAAADAAEDDWRDD